MDLLSTGEAVPMASCLDRAVALALPIEPDLDLRLEWERGGEAMVPGGWYPPPWNHVSQPARMAHFLAPPL